MAIRGSGPIERPEDLPPPEDSLEGSSSPPDVLSAEEVPIAEDKPPVPTAPPEDEGQFDAGDLDPSQGKYTPETWPGTVNKEEVRRARYRPPKRWEEELPPTAPGEIEAEWVHSNLFYAVETTSRGNVRINYLRCTSDPPSRGALALLAVAARDPKEFEAKIRPSMLKNAQDDEGEIEKRDRMQLRDIELIVRQFKDAGRIKEPEPLPESEPVLVCCPVCNNDMEMYPDGSSVNPKDRRRKRGR